MPALASGIACLWTLALSPNATAGDAAKELGRLAKLPAAQQCLGLEALLDARGLDEASRRTALARIRDLALEAAPPLSDAERALVEELKATSSAVVEPLVSRYAILLGSGTFAANATTAQVPGLLDATYVVQRQLFATDPVKSVGRRLVFHPEKTKPWGWSIQPDRLVIAYGEAHAEQGSYDELMAHEISHAFTSRHPSKHLFAAGFGEGWSDLAIAYTGERLGFLGGPLEKTWPNWRDGILAVGNTEYVDTRLPVEEIVAYGPSVSVVLRLALDASGSASERVWDPLAKLFRDGAASPAPWMPGHLWPARFARDMQRAFPGDPAWNALSRWRFPLDPGSQKEIEVWSQRARQEPAPKPADPWKADAQFPVTAWRVLGPIPVPAGRWSNVDFDPLDAWNFVEHDEVEIAGTVHRWRSDVPVDADGIVQIGALPGAEGACVFYLRADLPAEAEGPLSLFTASDDECGVWLDGQLVSLFRGNRRTDPADPDRAYGRAAKGGGRILAQVANYGGPTGFHLRWSKGTPFETTWRTEARAPDPKRRLMAVRRYGSMRVPFELVSPLYDTALVDGSPEVRAEAARLLGGRRNEPRAVEELLATWTREKDERVGAAIRGALSELALRDLPDSAAAHRWWREEGRGWREAEHVEAELVYALRSAFGGFYGNNSGAHGNQHVGRCFGGDRAHALNLVIEAKKSGPYVLAVRYASADGERKADVRVRRGEQMVAGRFGAVFPKTEPGVAWTWQEVALGVLPAGRYRVEIGNVDGCLDLDVLGLRPTRP